MLERKTKIHIKEESLTQIQSTTISSRTGSISCNSSTAIMKLFSLCPLTLKILKS